MTRPTSEKFQVLQVPPKATGVKVGRVVEVRPGGSMLVDFPGNPFGPVPTRLTASVTPEALREAVEQGAEVLLAFDKGDPGSPILFDVVARAPSRRGAAPKAAPRQKSWKAAGCTPAAPGLPPPPPAGARLARIVSVRGGRVHVDYEGNGAGPLAARVTVPLRNLKDDVLVLLLPGGEPVIVGQVLAGAVVEDAAGADVVLKGAKIRIEAETELTLVAGGCKIQLDARGKAVTTADQIVSRASGTNKVQGGCVQLN